MPRRNIRKSKKTGGRGSGIPMPVVIGVGLLALAAALLLVTRTDLRRQLMTAVPGDSLPPIPSGVPPCEWVDPNGWPWGDGPTPTPPEEYDDDNDCQNPTKTDCEAELDGKKWRFRGDELCVPGTCLYKAGSSSEAKVCALRGGDTPRCDLVDDEGGGLSDSAADVNCSMRSEYPGCLPVDDGPAKYPTTCGLCWEWGWRQDKPDEKVLNCEGTSFDDRPVSIQCKPVEGLSGWRVDRHGCSKNKNPLASPGPLDSPRSECLGTCDVFFRDASKGCEETQLYTPVHNCKMPQESGSPIYTGQGV